MTQKDISKSKNADLRGSETAIRRAAEQARQTAIQTGTGLIIVEDGKPVRIPAAELGNTAKTSTKPNP